MLCISSPYTDPCFNMATEEYLLCHFSEDIFMLWRNAPSIVVGRYQNTAAEINVDFVKRKNMAVVRRLTGGGAVFHDLGNLNYTFIEAGSRRDFRAFTRPIIRFLQSLGVDARFEGRNDLTIGGRKFSGTAQCLFNGKTLHHGTLLFSSEMADLSAALKTDPLKFRDKAVKSVRRRVTNISEHLPRRMELAEFTAALMADVRQHTPDARSYALNEKDVRAITELRNQKYATWEWNFGASPPADRTRRMHTAGGNIEIDMTIRKGYITGLRFSGDFFSPTGPAGMEQRLVGQPYREENIRTVLSEIKIEDYIYNVEKEEIIQLMFG